MARALRTLLEGGTFFEGPRWHHGTWWVSDFYRHAVYRVDTDGTADAIMEVPTQPSGLGWMPDGSMLVVSMRDQRVIRRMPDGSASTHADLGALLNGHANDLVADATGRAYVGSFGFDLMGGGEPRNSAIAMVDVDGTARIVADDLAFPNGAVITPDGSTLIVGETMGNRYSAFTIGDDGSLGDRRSWAEFGSPPAGDDVLSVMASISVAPDGCCLDAKGRIWAADALGNRVVLVAEGGELLEEVPMPEGLGAFACMLGGADGTTLLICAAPDFFEANRANSFEAMLLTCEVDVPRAGLP